MQSGPALLIFQAGGGGLIFILSKQWAGPKRYDADPVRSFILMWIRIRILKIQWLEKHLKLFHSISKFKLLKTQNL